MFAEFINTYGTTIMYAIITTIAGYIGIAVKKIYQKYIDDKTKKDVAKTVVQAIEQIYKDLHGEDKLNIALENASEMLEIKGIIVSELELRMLLEAAVSEFNNAFNKANAETPAETTETDE